MQYTESPQVTFIRYVQVAIVGKAQAPVDWTCKELKILGLGLVLVVSVFALFFLTCANILVCFELFVYISSYKSTTVTSENTLPAFMSFVFLMTFHCLCCSNRAVLLYLAL